MEQGAQQPGTTVNAGCITQLVRHGHRDERVAVYLDGVLIADISAEVAVQQGLAVGQELDASAVAKLFLEDERKRALDAALRLLAVRPRSVAEMRQRLQRKGFSPESIESVLETLQEWHYLDDTVFANLWVQSRQHERGRRRLQQELREKGIDPALIQPLLPTADEELAAARRLAAKHMPRFHQLPKAVAQRRLAGVLERRGFSWQTIRTILHELGAVGAGDFELDP